MAHKLASLKRIRRAQPGLAAPRDCVFASWAWRLIAYLIVCCIGFGAGTPALAQHKSKQQQQSDLGTILKPPKVDSTQPMLLQADEMTWQCPHQGPRRRDHHLEPDDAHRRLP
jgi:hypothetical protein